MSGETFQKWCGFSLGVFCVLILIVFSLCLWASDFLVTPEITKDGQGISFHFPSGTDVYFQVWASDSLTGQWTEVRGMTLGAEGDQSWTDANAIGTFTGLYYRLRRLPLSDPDDYDGDGIDDVFELRHPDVLNPRNPHDAYEDPDKDGLTNIEEYQHGTDPEKMDTDGDGMTDGAEVRLGLDPLNPHDAAMDSDADGLPDRWEAIYEMDPYAGGTNDIEAWYRFEETSGTNAIDSSGNQFHARMYWTTMEQSECGPIGRAKIFDGQDDHISLAGNSPSGFMHDAFTTRTVCLWVKARDLGRIQVLYDQGGGSSASKVGLAIRISTNQLQYGVANANALRSLTVPFTDLERWRFVAAVFSNGVFECYLDGEKIAFTNTGFKVVASHMNPAGLGCRSDSDAFGDLYGGYFHGSLDDVRIYKTALSSNDIYGLYELGADPDGDGLGNYDEYQYGTCPWNPDSDDDGLSDGLEVLYGTNPNNPNDPPSTAMVHGMVTCEGVASGRIRVLAATSPRSWTSDYSVAIESAGAFAIQGLPTLTNYWLKAFVDSNDNGVRDYGEAFGRSDKCPVFFVGNSTPVHIELRDFNPDLDTDGDGMPDWWEELHELDAEDPVDAAFDPDLDGVPNLYEYIYGTNPRNGVDRPAPTVVVPSGGSIQASLLVATNGYDIVLLQDGVYTGAQNRNLSTTRHVLIMSQSGPEYAVIDCENAGRGFNNVNASGCLVLSGITVKNGYLSGVGAGIAMSGSSMWALNCVISSNRATGQGAGVYIYDTTQKYPVQAVFDRCRFEGNYSETTSNGGGALYYTSFGTGVFLNCVFVGNQSMSAGGACSIYSGSALFDQCTFTRNAASLGGGALHNGGGTIIRNSIVWSNTTTGIRIWRNYVSLDHCVIQEGIPNSICLVQDPMLAEDGWHLLPGSPCIDAGTNVFISVDLDGESRPIGSGVDIGADEYTEIKPVTLSGVVVYEGAQVGPLHVMTVVLPDDWIAINGIVLLSPGEYSITNVFSHSNYWVIAFCDSNTNGIHESHEAWGVFDGNPVFPVSSLDNVDITLTDPDTDGDGLPDWWELKCFGDIGQGASDDSDQDGISNLDEFIADTNPADPRDPMSFADISGQVLYAGGQTGVVHVLAVLESEEWMSGYQAMAAQPSGALMISGVPRFHNYWINAWLDANGNGEIDFFEAQGSYEMGPLWLTQNFSGMVISLVDPDHDGDGMPDWWELAHSLNPFVNDADGDLDGDGLTNIAEFHLGSLPESADSDGDGVPDGLDAKPLSSEDTDQDGLPDDWERFWFGNISGQDGSGDGDDDGLSNTVEFNFGTDPTTLNMADDLNRARLKVFLPKADSAW